MSWVDTLFGGGREQAGQDMFNQFQQGWGQTQGMMNPYVDRGNTAYQAYIDALNQGKDPTALYNQFASSYKMSPEAQAQIQVGQKAANNASAASGMLGSGAEQTAAANLAQSIRSQDFDKYMSNLFGIRDQYLSGQGGLEQQGFNASSLEAQLREKYAEQMAQAKAAEDEGRAQGIGGLFGAAGNLFGSIFNPMGWGGGGMGGVGGSGLGGGATGGSWLNPDTGNFVNY